jgi:hypothetical protein
MTPDATPILEAHAQETIPVSADWNYRYQPISGDVKAQSFFVASESNMANSIDFVADPEGGITLTDHPGVANGEAGSQFMDNQGKVFELKFTEQPKLLDGNQTLPAEIGEGRLADMTFEERAELSEKIRAQGYDGYHFTDGEANTVHVYDKAKLEQTGEFAPNEAKVPKMDEDKANAIIQERVAKGDLDEVEHAYYQNLDMKAAEATEPKQLTELQSEEKESWERVQSLQKMGKINPKDQKIIELFEESSKRSKEMDKVIRDAAICVGGS